MDFVGFEKKTKKHWIEMMVTVTKHLGTIYWKRNLIFGLNHISCIKSVTCCECLLKPWLEIFWDIFTCKTQTVLPMLEICTVVITRWTNLDKPAGLYCTQCITSLIGTGMWEECTFPSCSKTMCVARVPCGHSYSCSHDCGTLPFS